MIDLAGLLAHWRRDWIKAPGFEDRSTHVHWMQCGRSFADIRVPADLPDISSAPSLSALDSATLLSLMGCEGFAGEITLEGDICTWHRAINWHGAPDTIDAGRLWFAPDGTLMEDGVHADYQECWRAEPDPPVCIRQGMFEGQQVRILSTPLHFILAIGHSHASPSAHLKDALIAGRKPPELAVHFDALYAFGAWTAGAGIAIFCTNPLLNGQEVLTRADRATLLKLHRFNGDRICATLDLQERPAQVPA